MLGGRIGASGRHSFGNAGRKSGDEPAALLRESLSGKCTRDPTLWLAHGQELAGALES